MWANVMANIGAAICESSAIPFLAPRRKVWLTPAAGVPRSDVTTGRLDSPLKFAGVPQTPKRISAVSGLKFTIL